jgi:hypothetical protein
MKKKFAVFCPLKDERTHSLVWLEYYSRFLPKEDIYILDFNSTNNDIYDCNIVSTTKNIFDAWELFYEIKRFHAELLEKYEYVIPTDVDEILFHPAGLNNYVNNLKEDYVRASGYELIHLPDKEPEYDPSKKILEQRNFWFKSPTYYDKTLITNKALDWSIGLHTIHKVDNNSIYSEKDLLLIHLHRFDYNKCVNRHLEYANKEWSERTVRNNNNWHYREKDKLKIDKWYFSNSINYNIVQIPEDLKSKILI